MLTNVYQIYDNAAEEFIMQFMYSTDELALRELGALFESGVLFKQFPAMKKYPNTFTLIKVATFDSRTGVYTDEKIHQCMFDFSKFVPSSELVTKVGDNA